MKQIIVIETKTQCGEKRSVRFIDCLTMGCSCSKVSHHDIALEDENLSYSNNRDADAIANVNFSGSGSLERYCVGL